MKKPRSSPNTCGSTRSTSGIFCGVTFTSSPAPLDEFDQILTVARLLERLGQGEHLFLREPALVEGDLFGTRHLETLAMFDGLDEGRGLHQRVVRAGVEPGYAAAEDLHAQ